jgi:serine/threonine-protein kinase
MKDNQMKICPACGKEYPNTMTLCSVDAAVLQNPTDPLLGQTLAGKYLVEKLIKRGGMGAVYQGKHVLMDKTVAIKVLRPALAVDDDVVARFSREAKAASRISHPHAVSVTDFGESENGIVFLVMEYLEGRTLKEIIRSEGAMPLTRVVEIIRQVTGALDAAHGQGVVHRDLKSDNIMVSQTNGGDWAKVLDFGIAKIQQPKGVLDPEITAANLVIGTPQYMSPEQCSQTQPLDARSDIYSLGVIIYEMLAGRVPFTGESATMIMMQHVQDSPPSVLATRRDLPPAVDGVITRALAKVPADRFQTAGELFAALSTAAGEDVSATPRSAETVASAPVSRAADDLDEETVVRPRETPQYAPPAPAPDALMSFSPWRIIVPLAIVLVVVFGVVFLLTRSAGQTPTNKPTPGQTELAADPNSQPVQPSSPPNGASEHGIQPLNDASPAGNVNANANANQRAQLPPDLLGNFGANANENDNTSGRGNKNTNQPRESPTPKSVPADIIKTGTPPPPKTSPSVKSVEKVTATPPGERR